jgi:hypothetical protein
MLGYNELYELLRKEKFSESLQPLPKKFLEDFKDYLVDKKESTSAKGDLFSESVVKSKKQLENSISIFRELMLKRKRKILNLVFVATETGIMKRDYENMLSIEQEIFERMVKSYEECDKEIAKILDGDLEKKQEKNKMIIFREDIQQFITHNGQVIGPFKTGEAANLESEIADILVGGGKATLIDEN